MTLQDQLKEIRERLDERMSNDGDNDFYVYAPQDISRLLRVVEVLGDVVCDLETTNAFFVSDMVKEYCAAYREKAQRILEGKE